MSTNRRKAWAMAPALIGFALLGCGGGAETGEGNEPETEAPAPAAEVANAATLNVAVNFSGTAPAAQTIDMSEEKVCADKHAGGAKTEEVVVNGGKLQNVFVYVKEGLSGTHAAPSDKVTIDQDGCVYQPRVAGVMVGQQIAFKNSDGVLHNIKTRPSANRPF